MNLHDITFNGHRLWLWADVSGWRYIGTHLYELEEGIPPPLAPRIPADHAAWRPRTPDRWNWEPYKQSVRNLFPGGIYSAPLCKKKSKARDVRGSASNWRITCGQCATIARDKGLISRTWDEAKEESEAFKTVRRELTDWTNAGAPTITDENLATFTGGAHVAAARPRQTETWFVPAATYGQTITTTAVFNIT